MTVNELEQAVARMSPAELAEFAAWFDRFYSQAWDRQIAQDVRKGRLGEAIRHAEDDFKSGRCKPL
jgi:hypothetical protein